jgi:putative DNA primase/helicase
VLADTICKSEHFAQDAGGKLYRYVGGVYKPKDEKFVSSQVKALCIGLGMADEWSTHLASEVVEFIRVDAPALWERPRLDILNVKNGLLRVVDRVLLPHSPDHLSPVQLPVDYDPKADCPAIKKFVSEVFPADAVDLAWEILGWLMVPNTSIQKAVLLMGEGANGKSTWLSLLIAFIGKTNTSSVSLHKLESDRFAAARLIGKFANICPDLPSEHLAGTSVFKAITGGDSMPGEYKFKDSFDFVPYARLVFSANHPQCRCLPRILPPMARDSVRSDLHPSRAGPQGGTRRSTVGAKGIVWSAEPQSRGDGTAGTPARVH